MNLNSSKGSARGTQVSRNQQIDLQHWSELEHRTATILLADSTLRDLYCQRPTVEYADENGEAHTHRFDFLGVYHDESSAAFNVKHSSELHLVAALFERLKARNLGFKLVCVTELLATDGRAANARAILKARQNYNHADYVESLQMLDGFQGRVLFHHLLKGARNQADRREALMCLVDRGVLVPTDELARLADYSYVAIDRQTLRRS